MKDVHALLATCFGIGRIPWAPGTWASAAAVPLFLPLLGHPFWHAGVLVVLYFVGVRACDAFSKDVGHRDPSSAVLDEILGMGVAMWMLPALPSGDRWPFLIVAFLFFRIFDIWKPFPVRKLEKLPGGWGIMTDDLFAGIYALAWVHVGDILVGLIAL